MRARNLSGVTRETAFRPSAWPRKHSSRRQPPPPAGLHDPMEEGFVPHLLVLKALEDNGMSDTDITIVNTPTNDTPQVLKSDEISAICAWQPSSGTALKQVPGSKPIYTSKDIPGLIYDCLFVTEYSLKYRRDDWVKVVKVWYRIVDYIKDEDNTDDILSIFTCRVRKLE